MSSSRIPRLVPNKHWLGIVDRLLGEGTQTEQLDARETMWVEVERYVVRFARLPIGPLADDPDVRLDIAAKLLGRLEQNDFRHVRTWRERQRYRQDGAAWWGWIGMMTRSLAIDAARGSRQNLAPRGEPYRWARIVSVDPSVFDEAQWEALGRSLRFIEEASAGDVEGYLAAVQDAICGVAAAKAGNGDGEPPSEPVPLRVKRGENGDDGAAR
jgi:hypothetical protein